MSELESELQRTSKSLPQNEFNQLLELTLEVNWLETYSNELEELYSLFGNDKHRQLVENLLKQYCFITSKDLTRYGNDIASHIQDVWKLTAENTLLIATCDDEKPDGSQALLQSLKNKFSGFDSKWSEGNFKNNIKASLSHIKNNKNLILVDDFIGTGKTIKRKTNWFKNKLHKIGLNKDINLYVISLAAMNESINTLNELQVEYYCPIFLGKGISDFYCGETL